MKPVLLNLTPRRKEVLWHAAYSTAEWSADLFKPHAWGGRSVEMVKLAGTDVSQIVRMLARARLIKVHVVEVGYRKHQIFIRITPLGMDVLLGNVECVDPDKFYAMNRQTLMIERRQSGERNMMDLR